MFFFSYSVSGRTQPKSNYWAIIHFILLKYVLWQLSNSLKRTSTLAWLLLLKQRVPRPSADEHLQLHFFQWPLDGVMKHREFTLVGWWCSWRGEHHLFIYSLLNNWFFYPRSISSYRWYCRYFSNTQCLFVELFKTWTQRCVHVLSCL